MSDIYADPITIKLFQPLCKTKYEDAIKKIIEAHKVIWGTPRFPHYTMHGKEHVEHIILSLNEWLKDHKFSESEGSSESAQAFLFILVGAIYLHDIGMQCNAPKLLKKYADLELGLSDHEKLDWISLEKIRENHQVLSYYMIKDSQKGEQWREYSYKLFPLNALNLPQEMNAIALLSASHADIVYPDKFPRISKEIKKMEKGLKEYTKFQIAPGVNVNLKKLTVILRIGDALDAGRDRIDKERLDKEKVWKKLFLSASEGYGLRFLFHILKHYFVKMVKIEEENKNIIYLYEFPKSYENDKKLQSDLIRIAEYPLLRNLTLYSIRPPIQLPNKKDSPPCYTSNFDLLKAIEERISKDRAVELRKLINREAKKYIIDHKDSLEWAENKIWIVGQNLHFLADPSRADCTINKDFFFEQFREKLDKNKEFKIWMLIYNPMKEWESIRKWHNDLIETWLKQSVEEKGEHKEYPPDFVKDLEFSFNRFREWCANLSELKDRFVVKCITPKRGFSSVTMVDPDDYAFMVRTHRLENAHPDPLSRSIEIFFNNWKADREKYAAFFEDAIDINTIGTPDCEKLSSYVIKIDLVKKICESFRETEKIQKYLNEKISRLQSVINRIPAEDKYYNEFISKKGELEKILNEFLSS